MPSNTYIATWLAVIAGRARRRCRSSPTPRTYNLDPARIEAAITPRTKVILPVHLYGQPADLDAILDVARGTASRVLEDAAQAHGARYDGRRVGGSTRRRRRRGASTPARTSARSATAARSRPTTPTLADRMRVLRNYGSRVKYVQRGATASTSRSTSSRPRCCA